MLYMVTFTINIPQMLAYIYIAYMDPMGYQAELAKLPCWSHYNNQSAYFGTSNTSNSAPFRDSKGPTTGGACWARNFQ